MCICSGRFGACKLGEDSQLTRPLTSQGLILYTFSLACVCLLGRGSVNTQFPMLKGTTSSTCGISSVGRVHRRGREQELPKRRDDVVIRPRRLTHGPGSASPTGRRRRSRLHRRIPSCHDARRSYYFPISSAMAHKINEEGILLLEQPFARVNRHASGQGRSGLITTPGPLRELPQDIPHVAEADRARDGSGAEGRGKASQGRGGWVPGLGAGD